MGFQRRGCSRGGAPLLLLLTAAGRWPYVGSAVRTGRARFDLRLEGQCCDVHLDSGVMVRGNPADGVVVYPAIRYAEAPRFGVPSVLRPQEADVVGQSEAPPVCFQMEHHESRGEEDCLYLIVTVPSGGAEEGRRLPVMVWIHGGSFVEGEAGKDDLGVLADEGGIIVVSIQYRLSLFGFFADPTNHSHPTNLGLRDQIAALQWVQANIHSFGGDPGRVTIAGQSAGGRAVLMLYQSPLARGLFQRAISQSGGLLPSMAVRPSAEAARHVWARCLNEMGCDSVACLRARPAEELGRKCYVTAPMFTAVADVPFIGYDGEVLPGPLHGSFCEARTAANADRPLLLGGVRHEWNLFDLTHKAPRLVDAFLGEFLPGYLQMDLPRRACVAAKYLGPYAEASCSAKGCSHLSEPAALQLAGDIYSLGVFLAFGPGTGRRYRYLLDNEAAEGPFGASHGSDKCFLFSALPDNYSSYCGSSLPMQQRSLGRTIREYWESFIQTGVPKSSAGPDWAPAGPDGLPFLSFSVRDGPTLNVTEWVHRESLSRLERTLCGHLEVSRSGGGGCDLKARDGGPSGAPAAAEAAAPLRPAGLAAAAEAARGATVRDAPTITAQKISSSDAHSPGLWGRIVWLQMISLLAVSMSM